MADNFVSLLSASKTSYREEKHYFAAGFQKYREIQSFYGVRYRVSYPYMELRLSPEGERRHCLSKY